MNLGTLLLRGFGLDPAGLGRPGVTLLGGEGGLDMGTPLRGPRWTQERGGGPSRPQDCLGTGPGRQPASSVGRGALETCLPGT